MPPKPKGSNPNPKPNGSWYCCWLLPLVRYFAYVQVAEPEQNLWDEYTRLSETSGPHFAMRKVTSADQIYPVFRELFKKEGAAA